MNPFSLTQNYAFVKRNKKKNSQVKSYKNNRN